MKGIRIILVLFIFSSCVGKEIQATIAQDNEPHVVYQNELVSLLDSFDILKTPILFDSTFFRKYNSIDYQGGNLNSEAIQVLTQKYAKDEFSSRENYYINAFLEIEEAKANDKYAEYQEKLESGMTENAVCRAIGRIELGDSVGLLLWDIKYESFPACPFYKGHHVLGTVVYRGKTISCMHIASNETGADAPMQFEAHQLATLYKNGVINVRNFSQTHEENLLIENSSSSQVYQFSSTGFEIRK